MFFVPPPPNTGHRLESFLFHNLRGHEIDEATFLDPWGGGKTAEKVEDSKEGTCGCLMAQINVKTHKYKFLKFNIF